MTTATQDVFRAIVSIIEDVIQDWDVEYAEEISEGTLLGADLQFSSIDVIHLVVAIEEHFARPKMGFEGLLMHDGRYVDDLTVGQLVAFVGSKLDAGGS